MKKVNLFFAFILLLFISVDAQTVKKLRALGDEAYKAHHYKSAIEYYQLADGKEPKNTEFKFKLAESYRHSFRYAEAEKNYHAVAQSNSKDHPLAMFYYALTQKMNNKYQDAIKSFDAFIQTSSTEKFNDKELFREQANIEKAGCVLAIDRSSLPFRQHNFRMLPTPVNSSFNDYAAFPFDEDKSIVITSGRIESEGKGEDTQIGENYTDCFRFKGDSSNWSELKLTDDFDKTNQSFHEGTGSFNSNFTKYYFTRCDGPDCSIFYTKLVNGKWAEPTKLNASINTTGSESKHPSLSITGDTIFFISNRPGGHGMNDIYWSVSKGEDNWGLARNAGNKVNTKFNEASPFFLSKEKILVFASQGHAGYGGFDIFLAKNFETIPENIGKPFNSEVDDMYFAIGIKKGYISSNRPGGLGNFDIYSFDIESEKSIIADLEKIATSQIDSVAQSPASDIAGATDRELGQVSTFNMAGYKSLTITGTLYDCITGKPIEGIEVLLVDEGGEVSKMTTSNGNGQFRYTSIPLDQRYRVIVKGKSTTMLDVQKLCVKDLKVDGFKEVGVTSKFENIYFDFDQSSLRPEATKTLDALSEMCKANSAIQIEIDAYTDFIGTDQYNDGLSKLRGEATFKYLLQKGTDRTSLVVIAKGEKSPAAPNETPVGRQLNRRVEFIIKGAELKPIASTYIIEPKSTLYSLAKKYGITVDELKKLNGLTNDHIETYRPLRVPSGNMLDTSLTATPKKDGSNTLLVTTTYVVKNGDTIFSIAVANNMTVERLIELNNINGTFIKPGQLLKLEPR